MTSTFEKYSQVSKTTTASATRSFCPLILYHDKPSKQLSINLNVNKHNNRTAIDRHRDKTNEMLEHNAQFWTEKSAGLVVDDEADYLDKDIKVSPSTSTTSNISSSSSSSGESIATIDMQGGHHHNIRSPVISTSSSTSHLHHVGLYYNEVDQQEDKQPFYQPKITNKPLPTVSKSSIIPVAAVDPTKKRRRGNLPKEVTEFLRKWLIQHKKHPYPAEKEKADLARHTGLTVNQISNWFINARRRILQPMLESENLTAQMMAYPDHLAPVNGTSAGASSLSSSSFEPPRRRRHDFYSYQRDFGSSASPPPPPPMHHHHHQEPSSYNQHHQHHYLHSPPPIEEDDNNQRFIFRTTRLVETNDHYNQIPMR